MSFYMHLLGRHLRQFPGRAAVAVLVLTVAATLLLALGSAGLALRFRLGAHLEQLFPEERVQLEAARGGFGPLAAEARPITPATLRQMTANPDVAQAWGVESIRFPIRVQGNLFGQELTSDAVIHGMARELLADALPPHQAWDAAALDGGGPVPLVVSNLYLDIYNLGLARASGLPLLNPGYVLGKHVTLVLGESAVGLAAARQTPRQMRARVVGISRNPAVLGLALPPELVRALNAEYAPATPTSYVQLIVTLRRGAPRERFLAAAQAEGLVLSGGHVLADRLKRGVRLGGWGLIGLAAAVFGLGLLTFYMLFALLLHGRRLDLLRLRALGATPAFVLALALGEVLALAALALAVALAATGGALGWAAGRAAPWLQQVGTLPAGLLTPNWPALAGLAALLLVLTLLPAVGMLRGILSQPVAAAVRDL